MGFELDEYLVGKFFKQLKKRKKTAPEVLERTVFLNDIKPRLTILARALTGKLIDIFPAEREGGYKNNNFFLPISFAEFQSKEDNLTFYLFRMLFLSVQQRLNLNWTSEQEEPSLELSQQKALEKADSILKIIFEEYAIDKDFYLKAKEHFIQQADGKNNPDFSWLYGKWMKNDRSCFYCTNNGSGVYAL